MTALTHPFTSSIGRKFLVAISGLALLGFVLTHLAGNLLIFGGPDAINTYSQSLLDLGPGLWALRGGLLFFFVIHLFFAIKLSFENQGARGQAYSKKTYQRADLPSRTMLISGGMIFAFILYHLAHYTFHWIHHTGHHTDSQGRHDVYRMVVTGFSDPVISGLYFIAIGFLAMHLAHAIPSVLQTLGITSSRIQGLESWLGRVVSALIFLGFVSIPISVLVGILTLGAS